MGLWDFFKKNKKEDNNQNTIISPTNGEILELASVPDEVFSQKLMGDGFAIKSSDGIIVSPVSGTVEMIFETKHAIGLKTESGLEILIHLGIDTVNLKGKGFEVLVKEKQKVKAGETLVNMDVEFIKNNAPSDISPIIFTNLKDGQWIKVITGNVNASEKNRIEICN